MTLRRPSGFTLVELLVVIAIIGILVALLLPAVQAAREAARKTECKSHVKNIALALQNFHDTNKQFPPGRAGSPRYPQGTNQHAVSWAFYLTPFVEEAALWDAWVPNARVDDDANGLAMRNPVSLFNCPSRRAPAADRDFDNNDQPSVVKEAAPAGDYAANAGLSTRNGMEGYNLERFDPQTFGPMYTKSKVAARRVIDGLSKTIGVGEKFMPWEISDADAGMDHQLRGDTAVFAGDSRHTSLRRSSIGFPQNKNSTAQNAMTTRGAFGSEHSGMSHFGFLDGSVQTIQHDIELAVFNSMAAVGDGGDIPDTVFED